MHSAAEEFVDYLLFVDEAPLDGKIRGSSGFAEKFASQGPQDSKGRSLRQFDLERRLMRYPCSYMIYSEAFDSLPAEAKDAIYQRMWSVLSGKVSGGKYDQIVSSGSKGGGRDPARDEEGTAGLLRNSGRMRAWSLGCFPMNVSPNWKYSDCCDDLFPVIEGNRLVLGGSHRESASSHHGRDGKGRVALVLSLPKVAGSSKS